MHCQNAMASLFLWPNPGFLDVPLCVGRESAELLLVPSVERGPFHVPDNQQHAENLLKLLFFFSLFLLSVVNESRCPQMNTLFNGEWNEFCCPGDGGGVMRMRAGITAAFNAGNEGSDKRCSLKTWIGLMWIFSRGWLLSYLQNQVGLFLWNCCR